jgi:hypothetical protein
MARTVATWLIIIGLATGLAACALPETTVGTGSSTPVEDPGPTTTMRPGLPESGPAVGDGGGLVSLPGGPPATYGEEPVVPACSLLLPEDLPGLGLFIRPGVAPGMVSQNVIDGTGEVTPYPLGLSEAPNSCGYAIGAESGFVSLHVHQPAYAGERELARHLANEFGAADRRADVEVRAPLRPFGDLTLHWLQHRDVHVELVLDLPDPSAEAAVLDHIARRLPVVAAAPRGAPRFGYDSPVLPVPMVDACAISGWADLGVAVASGGVVEEGVSPGIGLLFLDSGLRTNYVLHTCTRRGPGDTLRYPALTVRTTTYDEPDAAAESLAFDRASYPSQDTVAVVGDESIVVTKWRRPEIEFRLGHALVEVEFYPGDGPVPPDYAAALLPVARVIAGRVPRR